VVDVKAAVVATGVDVPGVGAWLRVTGLYLRQGDCSAARWDVVDESELCELVRLN